LFAAIWFTYFFVFFSPLVLRALSLSTARGRGVVITGDSLLDLMFPIDLATFTNLQTVDLSRILSGTDLISVSFSCELISSLEINGVSLTDDQLQKLMRNLPCLTHYVMYDVEGFDGYSWAKHPRLERLDLNTNSFPEEGAGQPAPRGSEDALKLTGEDMPLLRELSLWTRTRNTKDDRTRSVSSFAKLERLDARPCKTLILEDCPVINYASIDFSAHVCELQIRNVPLLNELEISFDKKAATESFKLEADLPKLRKVSYSHSREGLTLTSEIIALLECSPSLTELTVNAEGAVVDVELLWVISSTLKTIQIGDETHERPKHEAENV
jgi:hypothetical protein